MRHPEPIAKAWVNYVVLAIAMIFEGAAWYFAFREFSRAKGKWDTSRRSSAERIPRCSFVLFEDSAAMLGLAVAFVGIFIGQVTGNPIFDGLASVIIGLISAAPLCGSPSRRRAC